MYNSLVLTADEKGVAYYDPLIELEPMQPDFEPEGLDILLHLCLEVAVCERPVL